MKKAGPSRNRDDGMRGYYDFTGGVRGKYARRYSEGTNVVVLDPDVAQVFRDKESVNQTLRAVARILDMQSQKKRPPRPTRLSSRPGPRGRSGRHDRVRVGGRGG